MSDAEEISALMNRVHRMSGGSRVSVALVPDNWSDNEIGLLTLYLSALLTAGPAVLAKLFLVEAGDEPISILEFAQRNGWRPP